MNKPVFTRSISAGTRVYYVDANKDKKGQYYVSISQIPTDKSPSEKERQRIFIHTEKLDAFVEALSDIVNLIKNENDGKEG